MPSDEERTEVLNQLRALRPDQVIVCHIECYAMLRRILDALDKKDVPVLISVIVPDPKTYYIIDQQAILQAGSGPIPIPVVWKSTKEAT